MLKTNYIDQATFDRASSEGIVTDYHPIKEVNEGYSAYYKFFLRKEIQKYS